MNEVLKCMAERKSVRSFEDREIGEEEKQAILDAAMNAPSAGCQQLYTILDITAPELRLALSDSCDHQPFITEAKMVLVFCADCKKWYDAYKEAECEARKPGAGDLFLSIVDAAVAAQSAVIAAQSLGIGSCYIGDIMENCERQRELLHLPDYVFQAVMVVFGYPTAQQRERAKSQRCDAKYIVHENTYREMDGKELREMFAYKCGRASFEEWCSAFCARKYNSDFAKEMTRSVSEVLRQFS